MPGPEGLLFTTFRGNPWRPKTIYGEWRETLDAAGLAGFDFHELRHYYASLLIDSGASVKVVQARLGHKSAEETLNTYSHLWPDSDDRTRAPSTPPCEPSPTHNSRIFRTPSGLPPQTGGITPSQMDFKGRAGL